MKRETMFNLVLVFVLVLALVGGSAAVRQARAQEPDPHGLVSASAGGVMSPQGDIGTAFTYQGRLEDAVGSVNGLCDFQFSLWDAALTGSQVGDTQTFLNQQVAEGYFTVSNVDFGAGMFTGDERWLKVAVRCPAGSGGYTGLSPLVGLRPTPYALSLRPGAIISGTSTSNILRVVNINSSGAGIAAQVASASGLSPITGAGVWGDSANIPGVVGTSSSAAGVFGWSVSNSGVGGLSNSGVGVQGASSSSYGVRGESSGSTGTPVGVYGLASDAGSATSVGVQGKSNSTVGAGVWGEAPMTGVYGKATATSGVTYGVYGKTTSPTGHGVFGTSPSTDFLYGGVTGANTGSGGGAGVYGYSVGGYGVHGRATSGTGIYGTGSATGTVGIAADSSGSTIGVYGLAGSLSGKGVYGQGGYYGVQGYGTDPSGTSYGVYGYTESTSPYSYGGYFRNTNNAGLYAEGQDAGSRTAGDVRLAGNWGVIAADQHSYSSMSLLSNDDVHVYLDNDDNSAVSCFSIFDPGDSSIIPIWEMCHSDLVASGLPATIVNTPYAGARKLYGLSSPQVWVEDFGSGKLENGAAIITIESVFAQTVNLDDYHVFLTPLGDCNGLYVIAKGSTSFEVRELGGGASDVAFDYRIVARQSSYEDVRLESAQP